jgi:hypothetical protein
MMQNRQVAGQVQGCRSSLPRMQGGTCGHPVPLACPLHLLTWT